MELSQKVRSFVEANRGCEIPKPEAKAPFRVKGMGTRRSQEAMIYQIPSHTGQKPYEKGVTLSEFEAAFLVLRATGSLTREWFNTELAACAKEGACNFTSLGGTLELLGLAKYGGRGVYVGAGSTA